MVALFTLLRGGQEGRERRQVHDEAPAILPPGVRDFVYSQQFSAEGKRIIINNRDRMRVSAQLT